jgi:hypothetical protein
MAVSSTCAASDGDDGRGLAPPASVSHDRSVLVSFRRALLERTTDLETVVWDYCRASAQIGCVISYSSFRAETPPAAGSLLEKAPEGMVPSCANPAALEGGSGPLDAYLSTSGESINYEAKEPIAWTDPPRPIETPFVKVPGLLSARCVEDGHVAYLAVTRDTSPGGRRVSDIKGDSIRVPAFGLHQIDANLTMGNLLSIVADQTRTYLAQGKKN